jgi:hypothetical protein
MILPKNPDFNLILSLPFSSETSKDVTAEDEGITHLNVYSKSRYPLGCFLSNFAHTPQLQYQGKNFASVEAFWYWKLTEREELCTLWGADAKNKGRLYPIIGKAPTERELVEVYWNKIQPYTSITHHLKTNILPLVHYYTMYGKKINVDEYLWTAKLWEKIAYYLNSIKEEKS